MLVIPRGEYNPDKHIAEGDLVTVDWAGTGVSDVGIVLKVAIEVRNEDHLCPSKEILIAEVLLTGDVFVFDEEDIEIIEKCKQSQI